MARGPKLNTNTEHASLSELSAIAQSIAEAVDSDRWDEVQQLNAAFDNLAHATRFTAKDKSLLVSLIESVDNAKKQAESRQVEIGNLLKSLSINL
jgi:hypothetical protein